MTDQDFSKYRHQYFFLLFVMASLFSQTGHAQRTVRYDLYVKDTMVKFTGRERRALAVNGQIPMPALVFTQGDTAEIYLHNLSKESTSLHWHGVQLPNSQDGVPYLTQLPVKPGETYRYRFPVKQNGTYWYHSHSGLQEQIGMYGVLIFNKTRSDPAFRGGIDDMPEINVILSEWTDLAPDNVHRMLQGASDWFAIRKNAVQSYAEAIHARHLKTKLVNEWKRMRAMDVSDIYYDRFLINGTGGQQWSGFKPGEKVRLRIINAGASSYFWLRYAGGQLTVVANDGNDVEPLKVDRLLIAVSETYDLVVTVPADPSEAEFQATAEDRTGSASIFLGRGEKLRLKPLPRLEYFEGMKMMNSMMKMNGDLDDMGMKMGLQRMDMNAVMYPEITAGTAPITTLNYARLRSTQVTALPKSAKVKELRFELTGNMNRYVWSMDDLVLSESDKIPVAKGEILRITVHNNSMMRHPMHLHGYDFRLLNGQGDQAPLKNVLDIMPMETDTIEFAANTEGNWFFHCHILYHMMAGMDRVFRVGAAQTLQLPDQAKAYHLLQKESNRLHFMARNDIATNGNDGGTMLQNTRWSFGTEWRLGYHGMHGYETETHIGRYVGKMQWLMPFIGFDWRYRKLEHGVMERNLFGQKNTKDSRTQFSLGLAYTLPMLISLSGEVYHDGNLRFQLMREDIPLTRRLRAGFMLNTDKEYMGGLLYILTRNLGIRAHFDSDMGYGMGLSLNY